jgi:FixJ family two-component response regulator
MTEPIIAIVDDDESVRESLPALLRTFGLRAQAFASAAEFLASGTVARARCLVLDVAMPDVSGPELHRELVARGQRIPVVFITAHGDASIGPKLMAEGAVACIFKPFSDTELVAAIRSALS